MRKPFLLLLAVLMLPLWAAGQAPPPPPPKSVGTYKVVYNLNEMEGSRKINTRSYSLLILGCACEAQNPSQGSRGNFRIGSRVPILATSVSGPSGPASSMTYMDVGINIDVRLWGLSDDDLSMEHHVEVSGVSTPAMGEARPNPVIRRSLTNATNGVALGKPVVVASLDDVDTTHHTEIEVTVTRVK